MRAGNRRSVGEQGKQELDVVAAADAMQHLKHTLECKTYCKGFVYAAATTDSRSDRLAWYGMS